jgi:hypothetical protein
MHFAEILVHSKGDILMKAILFLTLCMPTAASKIRLRTFYSERRILRKRREYRAKYKERKKEKSMKNERELRKRIYTRQDMRERENERKK